MYDFLKLHDNWDAYMGVQKERKSTFLTAFEQREKEARSLFAAQYWYRSVGTRKTYKPLKWEF